jgi:hypothetical protein
MKAFWLIAVLALSEVASARPDPLDLAAMAQARDQAYQAVQVGDFLRGVGPATSEYQVRLDEKNCYLFSGTSQGLKRLSLSVDAPGAAGANSNSAGQVTLAYCPTNGSGVFKLYVQAEGKGRYTVAEFATPRSAGFKYVSSKQMGALALGQVASGWTVHAVFRPGPGGDVWTFVAPRFASYRFHVQSSDHRVEIHVRHDSRALQYASGYPNEDASVSLPLLPGEYEVDVDVHASEQGAYRLWVEEDRSKQAAVRAEDADVMAPLCAAAAPLRDGVTLGTFQSLPGGARAACGGTGSDAVYRLTVTRTSTVRLHAVTQFRFALELRAGCASNAKPIACVASRDEEGELMATVAPGEYFVVLDSTEIITSGAHIRGAFSLERAP